jgi:hypothetical protein
MYAATDSINLLISSYYYLDIIPVHALCLSHCTSSSFSPYPILFNGFHCISLCLVPIHMWCVLLLFAFFLSFLHPLGSSICPTLKYMLCIQYLCVCSSCWESYNLSQQKILHRGSMCNVVSCALNKLHIPNICCKLHLPAIRTLWNDQRCPWPW